MPLEVDIQGTRKRELLKLLDIITLPIIEDLDAILVIGSLGYNWDDHVFRTSDLDLMLIAELSRLEDLMHRCIPAESAGRCSLREAAACIAQGMVDMVSFKSKYRDIAFTVHYLDKELFARLCEWNVREIRAWRRAPKAGSEELAGFRGRRICYQPSNYQLPSGICHSVTTSVESHGCWFIGIPHGRLLHAPHIVKDSNHCIQSCIQNLWNAFLNRFTQETPEATSRHPDNVLDALIKSPHFGPRIRRQLRWRIEQFLSDRTQAGS